MKIKIGTLTHKGNHLYEDSFGKFIIGDEKRNRGYIIPKEKLKLIYLCQNRCIISLLLLIVLGFYVQWRLAFVLSAVCLLCLEGGYRYILSTCMQIDRMTFPQKITRKDRMLEESQRMNVLRVIAALAFPILLLINLFSMVEDWSQVTGNADQIILVLVTIGCSVYSIYICIISLSVVMMQKKHSS